MTIELEEWMWQVECGTVGMLPRYYYRPRWNNGWPMKVAFLGRHGETDWWWRPVKDWTVALPYLVAAFDGKRPSECRLIQNSAGCPEAITTAAMVAGLPARHTAVTRYELRKLAKAGKLKYAYEWGREGALL